MYLTRLVCFLAVLPLLAFAEQWTVNDVLFAERASGVELSRDGSKVVWVRGKMDKEKGTSASTMFVHYLADGETVQLTRGTDSYDSPKFSPDGKKIAFLSNRKPATGKSSANGEKPKTQVWLIDLRGGEPYKLTDFAEGVKEASWLDDNSLLLTAAEDPSLYKQQVKELKDTSNVVDDEDHEPPVRLYSFDVKAQKATRLTTNKDRITDTVVSQDGAWAVTVHERSLQYQYNQKIRPVTFLRDLKNKTDKQILTDGKLMPQKVVFAADAKGFYFSAPVTSGTHYTMAATPFLYYYDIAANQARQVDKGWERGVGRDFAVTPKGVLAVLSNGVRVKPALYTPAGSTWKRRWLEGEHATNMFAVEVSRDGKTIIYDYSTASKTVQWYSAKLDGAAVKVPKQFTKLDQSLQKKTFSPVEVVHWTGAKDEEVEGLLYYPHHYEKGKKYPLILAIHGGPSGADYDRFSDRWGYPHNLLAQRGAFLLKVNYHGSSDYGLKWSESITKGQYNELEWIDCETGVDAMIERGLADPDKLGVMGWSNGSIITIELTTRTTRYKAASAGAGDVNWLSDWGNCQFGHSFDDLYLGTTPLDDPDFYMKKSPLFRMDKVVTPTIIFFGTIDRQVPTEQGWQHYRALDQLGKTDVKFILFPGEAHGPRKMGHQRRKIEEELAWFDKYLFKTANAKNESLKPGSPLAAALQLKRNGDVPETVERGSFAIGRFEVTRAQFAAFRPNYSYPKGTANYPVNNVTADDAKKYCEWLSKKTGQTYRLGKEKEVGKMLKASAKENTLDRWAGYTVNADDAAALAETVKQLGADTLLRSVGNTSGQGEDAVYDLGGNVAEWIVLEDGSAKALGGSADCPADAKSTAKPAAEFIGFRVVRDLK